MTQLPVNSQEADSTRDRDFPTRNEDAVVDVTEPPGVARRQDGTRSRSRPRIMVVDDDDMMRKLLTKILNAQSYDVYAVANAVAALQSMQGELPDLILMDVQMPTIDGIELTRHLRDTEAYAAIPVLMLTGRGEQSVFDQCREAGAADVLLKPFERETLLQKVRQYALNTGS